MRTSHRLYHTLISVFLLLATASVAHAGDPGNPYPASSSVSSQKAGSILVYNVYTSSITNFAAQNSRITLTNTSNAARANAHLFFVDGSTCSVADSYLCLTPNQTATMMASDLDPGITGYLFVVAVNDLGCPINFNYLIGDVYVKFPDGHATNLGAEAIAAQFSENTTCDANSTMATLTFDASGAPGSYNPLPRVLAIDNISDRVSGNNTLLIINRIGGNMATSAATIGTLFGILYDDTESPYSFSLSSGACQLRGTLSNNFPRTTPRFETVVPAGRSGWLKLWGDSAAAGIFGAVINSNPGVSANVFNGGRNLHKLTLNPTPTITIPVFPPSC
ncbi:MAG: hypothetical protein SF339_03775 [Blastocatellia bacterium]|nr:hypothetical protein [Blastocatellia bacterium]